MRIRNVSDSRQRRIVTNVDLQRRICCMNSNMTVQTVSHSKNNNRPVSDLGLHMKVAQIRMENIRFHVIFADHT